MANREFLFRGKKIKHGDWIVGDLLHDYVDEGDTWIWIDRELRIPGCNLLPNLPGPERVRPETVGQFTGLTDKNGKRIFEGDILHIVSYTCDYNFKTSVGAKYGYVSGLYVDGDFDGGDFNEIGFAFDYWRNEDAEVEVIGNIHDNPELLEDQT